MIQLANIRGHHAHNEAGRYLGARVRYPDMPAREGTITAITTTTNGYVRFHVEWDPGAPDWWGNQVSPGSLIELVEETS